MNEHIFEAVDFTLYESIVKNFDTLLYCHCTKYNET